jgi:hypothetical protein
MPESADDKPKVRRPAPSTLTGLLDLPDGLRELACWLLRQGEVNLAVVMTKTGKEESECRAMLDELQGKGLVEQTGNGEETRYRHRLGRKRGAQISDDIKPAT